MKYTYDFFKDFNKLFYWFLILSSWFIAADIYCTMFLKIGITTFLQNFNTAQILLIFIFQVILILSGKILYEIITFIRDLIGNRLNKSDQQLFRDYYKHAELLNESVTTNNQVMYNYYKDAKDNTDFIKYQKRLIFTVTTLLFFNSLISGTYLNQMFSQYEKISPVTHIIFSFIIMIDIIGIILFFGYYQSKYFEYSGVMKVKPKQDLK